MFGKESLKIAKMLKQSGNRLEAGMGMKMQKTFPFQTLFFHCSFTQLSKIIVGLSSLSLKMYTCLVFHSASAQ